MFIEPIAKDLGASKATVALVGSLLSGFYLIVGPFVSGKSEFSISRGKIVNNMFSPHDSIDKPLWLPCCDDAWITHCFFSLRIVLLCTKCVLSPLFLRNRRRNWILFHLHAFGYHRWILLWEMETTGHWNCTLRVWCWLLYHGSDLTGFD